ncbi:pseudouridine synthase [Streptococcus massiliensis]|uniref:Pseudouridine synthase n=1 Tax=Streptococcus massiliensis TaxID=313439 RepID=A0A380KYB0_9STRE|nr:pseudouridine synthase [Streptococcus massiliensis]SUN76963.1 16S rRNA uridine-516 pseudouridylate synthase [Streptococcus massiliensis]
MRLDKFLTDCGIGTRSQVKAILKQKRIRVNGKIENSGKIQVKENQDQITLDRKILTHETFVYYMLNKPQGVISATEDERHKTVLDLLDPAARHKEVFPVGRLDIDTEGLLLLTNNGALAHALLSPKKHVEKTYLARISGVMTKEDQERFRAGISLKDFTCQPAQLKILEVNEDEQTSLVEVTIAEGKFHQVKRMVAACGKEVTYLKRLSMGSLQLDPSLKLGEFHRLTPSELKSFEKLGIDL